MYCRMETFAEVSSQMLKEFQCLLQHSPSPLGNVRILQLMAINMSAIQNTVPPGRLVLCESVSLTKPAFPFLPVLCNKLLEEVYTELSLVQSSTTVVVVNLILCTLPIYIHDSFNLAEWCCLNPPVTLHNYCVPVKDVLCQTETRQSTCLC